MSIMKKRSVCVECDQANSEILLLHKRTTWYDDNVGEHTLFYQARIGYTSAASVNIVVGETHNQMINTRYSLSEFIKLTLNNSRSHCCGWKAWKHKSTHFWSLSTSQLFVSCWGQSLITTSWQTLHSPSSRSLSMWRNTLGKAASCFLSFSSCAK